MMDSEQIEDMSKKADKLPQVKKALMTKALQTQMALFSSQGAMDGLVRAMKKSQEARESYYKDYNEQSALELVAEAEQIIKELEEQYPNNAHGLSRAKQTLKAQRDWLEG